MSLITLVHQMRIQAGVGAGRELAPLIELYCQVRDVPESLEIQELLTPQLINTTLKQLEKELGWDVPLSQEQRLPIYERLRLALILSDHTQISQAMQDLRMSPTVAGTLTYVSEHDLLLDLNFKIRSLIKAKVLYIDPGEFDTQYYHQIFNKQEFTHRMMLCELNLQDQALMQSPGGIHFLEEIFALPLTGRKEAFFFNYNTEYYTRQCAQYMKAHKCAYKMGEFRDIDAIPGVKHIFMYCMLAGTAAGGHLDLVQKYTSSYIIAAYHHEDFDFIISSAVAHGQMDVYLYLISVRPEPQDEDEDHDHIPLQYLTDVVKGGFLEFFRYFLSIIIPDEYENLDYELTIAAVRSKKQYMIDELKTFNMFDPVAAAETAIEVGDVELLKLYMDELRDSDSSDMDEILGMADNVEVLQTLYDAGIRATSVATLLCPVTLHNPDVAKFNLDHYDLGTLKTQFRQDPDPIGSLKTIFLSLLFTYDPSIVELFLNHPMILKYNPYPIMWDVMFMSGSSSSSIYENFIIAVVEMLIDRGFRFNARYLLQHQEFISPEVACFIRTKLDDPAFGPGEN